MLALLLEARAEGRRHVCEKSPRWSTRLGLRCQFHLVQRAWPWAEGPQNGLAGAFPGELQAAPGHP